MCRRRACGVERREQLVGGIGAGARQRVEQRRLAGIGVADQGNREHVAPGASASTRAPLPFQLLQALAQLLDAHADHATVQLDLLLTGSAGLAEPATLALQVRPAAHQPRRQVLQLRQFHLQLAFAAARALREDVEDQRGAVQHPEPERALEVALLRRRQRHVEYHQTGVTLLRQRLDFFDLARAPT